MTFARGFVLQKPWSVVSEVLRHEMAHQFVSEQLKGHEDDTPHGPAFQRICSRFGIDPRAAGLPEGEGPAGPPTEGARVLRKVQRLLALAESSNEHEAQSAMSAASRLMLKYNIAHLQNPGPRSLDPQSLDPQDDGYRFTHLGVPKKRISAAEKAWRPFLARTSSWTAFGCVRLTPNRVQPAARAMFWRFRAPRRIWRWPAMSMGS